MRIKLYEEFVHESLPQFIKSRGFKSGGRYPGFLFHGTSVHPSEFELDPDMDWADAPGNTWDIELPSGMLFLTTDVNEAKYYGKYVIPFELNASKRDILRIETGSPNPSAAFDDDYNYGSELRVWNRYEAGMYTVIEMVGVGKTTFIADFAVINPRIDIALEYLDRKRTRQTTTQ